MRRLWAPREESRYGAMVEPMLQYAKIKSAERGTQFVPCRAGVLSGVVHANGDVALCEQRPPIGNLRQNTFMEIWRSHHAGEIRGSIAKKECYCTNEIFMWPSVVYQPAQLGKAMMGAKVWERPAPLGPDAKVDYAAAAAPLAQPPTRRARAADAAEDEEAAAFE